MTDQSDSAPPGVLRRLLERMMWLAERVQRQHSNLWPDLNNTYFRGHNRMTCTDEDHCGCHIFALVESVKSLEAVLRVSEGGSPQEQEDDTQPFIDPDVTDPYEEPAESHTPLPAQGPGVLERLIELATRQQRRIHEAALAAAPLFSVEHWKHNAGPEWPHEPDDDSYLFFENCQHADCKLIREAALAAVGRTPEEPNPAPSMANARPKY